MSGWCSLMACSSSKAFCSIRSCMRSSYPPNPLRHQGHTLPYPGKYGALHGLGRATAGSYKPTKFSEVWAVASRNSLYRILTTSVALGARLRAKSSCQGRSYGPGGGREGKLATVNFREFHFHALG